MRICFTTEEESKVFAECALSFEYGVFNGGRSCNQCGRRCDRVVKDGGW
jgi:hypothetical protein